MSITSLTVNEICFKLRSLLENAVKKNLADGILLSGGLDTGILALIASRFVSLKAFTVALKDAPAPDIKYSSLVAKKLGLRHFIRYFNEEELHSAIRTVVKTVKSFDPMEVRNSVAIYVALKTAVDEGVSVVMTGDGCDELFAGYNFLFDLNEKDLKLEIERLWNSMSFSSIPLAEALGIQAKLPYLDPHLKHFAVNLDPKYKIRNERGVMWGKWILRKAFEELLPEEIAWRIKTPIEQGSGTAVLPSMFNKRIPDGEFEEKRRIYLKDDKVVIRDKEQLFYYEVYRSTIGVPHPLNSQGRRCPQCNSNVNEKAAYCRTCGAYPIPV